MYQTSKMLKLFFAKQGDVEQYKGMRLDDVEINMDPVYSDNIVETETISENIERNHECNADQTEKYQKTYKRKTKAVEFYSK